MSEFNSDKVENTLKVLLKVLESEKIKYRFLGSVLVAAINGKLHRNLGDLDLIIDEKDKDVLFDNLKRHGYVPVDEFIYNFARKYLFLETMRHKDLLEIGYFYGRWRDDGSMVFGKKNINVSVEGKALTVTQYSFAGIKFIGIPKQAHATRVFATKENPKRKEEMSILRKNSIDTFPDNYIHVKIFCLNFDWIYHFVQAIQNIVGIKRVKMGLSFDPWR